LYFPPHKTRQTTRRTLQLTIRFYGFNTLLFNNYTSPNIVRVKKSKRMRWAGHVACMGERRGLYRVLVGKPEGKNHLGDPGIDGRIILR